MDGLVIQSTSKWRDRIATLTNGKRDIKRQKFRTFFFLSSLCLRLEQNHGFRCGWRCF